MFQYKIIHNILCTKSLLFKMKKEDSPRCPFCPADHTIIHLFTECAQATLFWKEFLDWASRMVNSKLSLSIKEIMFGIINDDSKFCSTLNHLVIIGKYFLYIKALNGKSYTFNEFVSLARNNICCWPRAAHDHLFSSLTIGFSSHQWVNTIKLLRISCILMTLVTKTTPSKNFITQYQEQ